MSESKDSGLKTRGSGNNGFESRSPRLAPHKYQIFFRTSRGGRGIEYENAKAEFLNIFGGQANVLREISSRMRMEVTIEGLSADEIAHRARWLGYTQGITSVYEEPYQGEELYSRKTGRWVVGWLRRGDRKIHLTEIYRQDEQELLKDAPDKRTFFIEIEGEVRQAKGHRYRRGISPGDVRFMVNIAGLRGDETILDPFAGIGGILVECRKRNFRIFASDVDSVLRPGLAQFSDNRCAIADARRLPFNDNTFDAIITEPPFDTRYRNAVLDSITELRRVVRKKIVLLIAKDMRQGIMNRMTDSEFRLIQDFTLRRHSKLISHILRFDVREEHPK